MSYILYYILTFIPWFRRKPRKLEKVVGYGRVNYWYLSKSDLRKELARCKSEGINCYHIEFCGWAGTNILTTGKIATAKKRYKWLLRRCRALGMWLFVSIVNDNIGSRKYGDSGIPWGNSYGDVVRIAEFIRDCGGENVIVQPVAETHTDFGKSLENWCSCSMKTFALCYNGNYGQPKTTGGMDYRACHPSSIANATKYPGAIITSDHGNLIRYLHPDGYGAVINVESLFRLRLTLH